MESNFLKKKKKDKKKPPTGSRENKGPQMGV